MIKHLLTECVQFRKKIPELGSSLPEWITNSEFNVSHLANMSNFGLSTPSTLSTSTAGGGNNSFVSNTSRKCLTQSSINGFVHARKRLNSRELEVFQDYIGKHIILSGKFYVYHRSTS